MKVNIISLGKVRETFFREAIEEYSQRINKYATFNEIEIPDEKILENKPSDIIKEKEAEKIRNRLSNSAYKIAMTETGKSFSSEKFAGFIENLTIQGRSEISFIIGGALGLDPKFIKECDFQLSLSAMTLPHQMARLFLTEQIYRCFKIINNEPYHK